MNKPKVSICIATYKRSELLKKLVESIVDLNRPDCSFEVLLLNDSSFEEHKHLCESLEKRYPEVKYFQNDSNLGLFMNLAHNFDKISGKYVIFPGDDDVIYNGLIDKSVSLLDIHSSVGMVAPLFKVVYKENNSFIQKKLSLKGDFKLYEGKHVLKSYLGQENNIGKDFVFVWPSVMFRKSVLKKVGHFEDSTEIAGDTLLISKVLLESDFIQLNEILFEFVNHGDALRSKNSELGVVFTERIQMLDKLKIYIERNNKNIDAKPFYKAFAKQSLSPNGSIMWIAFSYKGSKFMKWKLIVRIFVECSKIDFKLLFWPVSYLTILSGLVFSRTMILKVMNFYAKLF